MSRVLHWVDGQEFAGSGERSGPVFDPATGAVSRQVALASVADVDHAVGSAARAFAQWSNTSLSRRQQVLFAFRNLLHERRGELAEIITSEHGKVLDDALGEVIRGQEVVEYACGIPTLLRGGYTSNASTNVDVYSMRQPLGVVGIVSPFNFPAMVPMWFFPLAIACGNTVVLKPSERDPSAANWLAELWAEAGLPPGVFNVLHGDRTAVERLLEHEDVAAISFVGSTDVARSIYAEAARHGKRVQALGGAKNHMVVLPDADLATAADAAVSAGFGSAGERCMAISVVVAVEPCADALIDQIVRRIGTLRVGDGRSSCDMGPLVTQAHLERVTSYVEAGASEGAELVVDGRKVEPKGDPGGFWLGPTLFDRVTPEMSIYVDEIFGPVLSVVRVPTFDDALELVNSHRYANGAALFTSDGRSARRFQEGVAAGMVGINVPIPVPMAYYSFGGSKQSLFGDTHAHGAEGVQFYTRGKVVTSRWPENQTGLSLGFPQTG